MLSREDDFASDRVCIAGGLSSADMALLLFARDFETVLQDVSLVSQGGEEGLLPYLKTTTLPCYYYPCLAGTQHDGEDALRSECDMQALGLRPEVSCSFMTGDVGRMLQRTADSFATPAFLALGEDDVVVHPDLTAGDLVSRLIRFRAQMAGALISTSTRLASTDAVNPSCPPPAPEPVAKGSGVRTVPGLCLPAPSALDLLRSHDDALARNIETLYECAAAYVSDPLTRIGFDDVVLPLTALAQRLEANVDDPDCEIDPILLRYYWECYRDLSMALRQRIASAQSAVNGDYQPPTVAVSASHRVTRAASTVAQVLLDQCGEVWEGCVTVDLDSDMSRLQSGAITIPHDTLAGVLDWWGLGHEVGHEHMWLNVAGLREGGMDGLLDTAGTSSDVWEADPHWFWAEIYAELFDFIIPMQLDWAFYVGTAWRYVQKPLYRDQIPEFAFRAALVKAVDCWQKGQIRGDEDTLSDDEADRVCNQFLRDVLGASCQRSIDWLSTRENMEDVRSVVVTWWPVARATAAPLLEIARRRRRICRDDSVDIATAWGKGEVALEIEDAVGALRELRRSATATDTNELPLGSQVAAILSLWHLGITRYSGLYPDAAAPG